MGKTHYLWDFANDSYLMEKDGNGATTAVYTDEPVPYGRVLSHAEAARRAITISMCTRLHANLVIMVRIFQMTTFSQASATRLRNPESL